ncbi:endonuclease domain-containing protein [Luteipulveratus mongoliensis]|uniref:endonuclease domain-containing protein n=1 Tax=Luteipulveratus mongoliensis TaxID=571913 RepID=UPI0009F8A94F|nr:DUF559 domain-containing protein [Luteipulveratus mongoliensis]
MFSHVTAARLMDLPLPRRLENDDRPIDVITPAHESQIRRAGLVGHRGSELRTLVTVRELPVASSADVWLDLANDLTIDELVVLGDAVVGSDSDKLTELKDLVRRSRGIRGVVKAREALELIRVGSRSPRESMVRMLLTRGGLPMPELNVDIHDAGGGWIAQVDFVWREQRVIVEYDGEVHAEPEQRKKDAHRRRQLAAEGWTVVVLTSADIPARNAEVLADLRRMLAI